MITLEIYKGLEFQSKQLSIWSKITVNYYIYWYQNTNYLHWNYLLIILWLNFIIKLILIRMYIAHDIELPWTQKSSLNNFHVKIELSTEYRRKQYSLCKWQILVEFHVFVCKSANIVNNTFERFNCEVITFGTVLGLIRINKYSLFVLFAWNPYRSKYAEHDEIRPSCAEC